MSVERARRLRKILTPQETKLWVRLRELRPRGHHPRRQDPIGGYIADFSFRRSRLIVEVDGGQHGGPADATRDAELAKRGYRVLRFWNSEVVQNLEGVLETILNELERGIVANSG